jgi:uncharacterized protein (TIGR01777 family)
VGTIVIAGGTGLLGTALHGALRHEGHRVLVLTRQPKHEHEVRWAPEQDDFAWAHILSGATAVINLAGTSIASGRWTAARKASIYQSRIAATRALVKAIADVPHAPPVFISGSAVGYYGARDDEPATEATPPGSDFLAEVCRDWEAIANQASARSRVVFVRSGVVFARQGGALPQLVLPFRLFAGGPAGSGRQFVSWIHLQDWVALIQWALAAATIAGPLNATAPTPVTNEELSHTIGRVLGRPSFVRAPAFALRLFLGEMADALVLGGQRVIPEVARQHGFVFRYPTVESALKAIYA